MSSFQGVGIEEFPVYRGVLVSGGRVPLYTEVSSFQGVEIEGFHCIQISGVGIEGYGGKNTFVPTFSWQEK